MNIVLYTLMAYGLTAVISFAVIAIVAAIGKLMGDRGGNAKND